LRLGVNIDHIATLRQARQESFPDPVEAAKQALAGGADGIVCHLREDRRHIQDKDVDRLKEIGVRLDLEMAATDEMVQIALQVKPEMVTLVPEKRKEITTEGGLDVIKQQKKMKKVVAALQDAGILVSLFIDPIEQQIEASSASGAKFIELHTGKYANAHDSRRKIELGKLEIITQRACSLGLRVNAGHGLDYNNVKDIVKIKGIEELNIGYAIIAQAVFVGLKKAVSDMRRLIK